MITVPIGLRAIAAVVVCAVLIAAPGCSWKPADQPPLGRVRGTVTMNGRPLPNVEIVFAPQKGRVSEALTDSAGGYELWYVSGTRGAKVGSHKVVIQYGETPADEPPATKRPKIPAKYNTRSELRAEVKPGSNTIDFAIESK